MERRRHETTQTELDLMRAAIEQRHRDTIALKLAGWLVVLAVVALTMVYVLSRRGGLP